MYKAYVTTLTNVRKAENADRLMIAECFGEQVIIGSEMYEGQQVLYLPADGEVQEWFGDKYGLFRKDKDGNKAGGYLERNGHVKAMKLRGNRSEGIAIPLEKIEEKFLPGEVAESGGCTKIGGKLFVKKYIPKQKMVSTDSRQTKTSKKGKYTPKKTYPNFEMHIDTAQLMYNKDAFRPGDDIEVTFKLHGTSQRSALVDAEYRRSWIRKLLHLPAKTRPEFVLGTRRVVVDTANGDGFYGTNDFRIPHHIEMCKDLKYGVEIFYEVVGWVNETTPIMPTCNNKKLNDQSFIDEFGDTTTFTYGCQPGESAAYVYRITQDGKDFTPEEIAAWCTLHGLKKVPDCDRFIFTTWEDLMERLEGYFSDIHDRIDPSHILEGVVFRIVNRNSFIAFKAKTMSFKILSGIVTENNEIVNNSFYNEILEEI